MQNINVVLVALYRYQNFPIRIMHPLLENIEGISPSTIFFKDCQTNILDLPSRREEELFIETLRKLRPALVAFSVLSPFVPIAQRLTRLVKDNTPSLVIWGGIHPTISPDSCIRDADIVCVGEGEGPLTDLVTAIRDNRPYHNIKNLWAKQGQEVIKNPMRKLIMDLDSLPFPSYGNISYHFINNDKLTNTDPLLYDYDLSVQTSRGCPYGCSYCVNSILRDLFKGLGPYTRRRSVKNVVKEIKAHPSVLKGTVEHISFVDEVFGTGEGWLDEFERVQKGSGHTVFSRISSADYKSSHDR